MVKIVPYYDRSELVDAALHTVTKVLLEGAVLVVVILFLFLGDIRSSLIVLATLILTPLLTFMHELAGHFGQSHVAGRAGDCHRPDGRRIGGGGGKRLRAIGRGGERGEQGPHHPRAVVEVATPVIFGVGIIILVFLPLMTLEGWRARCSPAGLHHRHCAGDFAGAVADADAGAVDLSAQGPGAWRGSRHR
jgi:cobalt-zinc-cadmium resistance protein CzcA